MGKSKKSYKNDFKQVVGKKICENKIQLNHDRTSMI